MRVNQAKKVLFVIGKLEVGGSEQQLIRLAARLDRTQFDPVICSLNSNNPFLPMAVDAGLKVEIIPQIMKPDLTRPFKLYKLIRRFRPDIIHSYLFIANTWARLIGFFTGIPVVISERNSEPKKSTFKRMVDRLLSPLGACLIANSKSGAERSLAMKEFSPKKIRVVYNGFEWINHSQAIKPEVMSALKHNLGIKEGSKVIGIIGRLEPQKNHELLFDSYKLIKNEFPDSCILCIGSGSRQTELQEYAEQIGINREVIFAGVRDDVLNCLAIMDVLVLSSRWEGLPNVVIEAMASRCPVVATNVGGVNELIKNDVTGWLAKPDDRMDMANKIKDVFTHSDKVNNIKDQALSFVKQNLTIDKMVNDTQIIYNEVLANK